jgi:hypothetical protein
MKNEILTDISRIDGKRRNEKLAMMILRISRGDRHLGYSSRHTQVPVPATTTTT